MSELKDIDDTGAPVDLMDATRHEILLHAQDLFAHYGFKKTNMSDIAARAGMSAGNVYRYFKNKHAIALACIQTHFKGGEAEMSGALIGVEEPEERIRVLLRSGVAHTLREMREIPKIMELVEFVMQDDIAWDMLQTHISWKRDHVMRALEDGVAAGIFKPCDPYQTAVNLMHATKAFQMPPALNFWKDKDTVLPELEGVLDVVFDGVRVK